MNAMKTMMTVVIDAGASMSNKIDFENKSDATKLSLGLGIISSHITQRMMASKTAEFGVVAYGVDETNNFLNSTEGGGYLNVNEVIEMSRPNLSTLGKLLEIKPGKEVGDIIDAIVVGQDILTRVNQKYKYNRIMLLITDGENEIGSKEDFVFLSEIFQKMKDLPSALYVVLVGKPTPDKIHIRNENAKFLESMARGTGGGFVEAVDLGDVFQMLSSGPGLGTRPQNKKITFEISPEFRIHCTYWSKVMKAALPSLKKTVKSSPGINIMDDAHITSSGVTIDRVYRNPSDPDEVLGFEDRVKGYKYGPQYIPITTADEDAMKLPPSEPIIKLLGFMSATKIPRHHFLESTIVVQAEGEDYSLVVNALGKAMRNMRQAALVRFVKSQNGDPWLATLVAPEIEDGTLLLHRLPCAEDVRDFAFPSLKDTRFAALPTSNQRSIISNLIDQMTIKSEKTPKLTTFNPALHAVIGEIQRQAIFKNTKDVLTTFKKPFAMVGDSPSLEKTMLEVKLAFPLKKAEEESDGTADGAAGGKKKKRTFWSDIHLHGDTKKGKTDGDDSTGAGGADETDQPSEEVVSPPEQPALTLSLGSVTPVDDFQAIVSAGSSEEISQAMDVLSQIVELLVTTGCTAAHFRKALACMKTMRTAAVAEGEHKKFNVFMRDVVKGILGGGKYQSFWGEVVREGVTLISVEEDSASDISSATAKQFLEEEKSEAVAQNVPEVIADDEDLFNSME
eukprot:gene5881-11878_t